jgi:hypothetical protein
MTIAFDNALQTPYQTSGVGSTIARVAGDIITGAGTNQVPVGG